MPAQSLIARPKWYYWLNYLWLTPMAGIVFSAFIVVGIGGQFGYKPTRPEMLGWWIITATLFTLFALNIDRRKPHYELTDTTLRIGRSSYATVIPLAEIETIVFGLPAHTPWWFRMLRYGPKSHGTHRFITVARANTLFIRFTNHRYVPRFLLYSWMHNGPEIMEALRERLRDKFVGQDTYTEAETAAFGAYSIQSCEDAAGVSKPSQSPLTGTRPQQLREGKILDERIKRHERSDKSHSTFHAIRPHLLSNLSMRGLCISPVRRSGDGQCHLGCSHRCTGDSEQLHRHGQHGELQPELRPSHRHELDGGEQHRAAVYQRHL
jgi:hypothetical protein